MNGPTPARRTKVGEMPMATAPQTRATKGAAMLADCGAAREEEVIERTALDAGALSSFHDLAWPRRSDFAAKAMRHLNGAKAVLILAASLKQVTP